MTPRGDTPFRFHPLTEPSRAASSERYAEESVANNPFKTPYGSQFENITPTSQSPQVEPRSVDSSSLQSQLTLRAIAECTGIVPETPWNELVDEVCNLTPAHSSLTPEMMRVKVSDAPPGISSADDSFEIQRSVAANELKTSGSRYL